MIHLTRIDPARNMARFYTMALQPTLFGEWALLKEWGGSAVPAGSSHVASPRNGRPPWPWPNISKPSSAKAMRPFEFCVLGLSELALFGAQTLRCPQVRGAFIVAQYASGARVANDILGLLADIIRSLDAIEQTITGGKP